MKEPGGKAAERKTAIGKLEIARGDVCDAFEQDESRLFAARECWYCRYGDFGILTEHPTQSGVCALACRMGGVPEPSAKRSTETLSAQKNKKQEEERR